MKILQALLCLTLLTVSDLFGGDFIIKLKQEKMNVDAKDFYIAGVIDGRPNKDNIGSAMLGIFNSRNDVKFEKETTQEIYDFICYSIPKDTLKTPVHIKILDLEVNEETRIFGEYAVISMSLGFYKKEGDLYGELGGAEFYYEESSMMDVTDFHEEHIRKALEYCINKFASKDLIKINPVYAQLDTTAAPSQDTTSLISTMRAKPKMKTAFIISGIVDVNSFGSEIFYSQYRLNGDNWVYPMSFSIIFMKIKDTKEFTTDPYFQFGFGYGALKPIGKHYKVYLRGCVPFGTETIKYYDGEKTSFFVGLQFSQNIIITPGDYGFGISFGIEEGFLINSELHPWDVGVRIGIGGGF